MHLLSLRWTLWNLFLAIIPVLLGYALAWAAGTLTVKKKQVPGWVWLPLALVWFAFLPNTCYLLTEWRHFLFDPKFEMLRDVAEVDRVRMLTVAQYGLFFLVYSGLGVLCFTLAIRPVENLLRQARGRLWLWAIPFFFLTSLGVYLGLIVRLNSWDLLHRPGFVWNAAVSALLNPLLLKTILVFAVILWLLYAIVNIWVDGLAARMGWQKREQGRGKREK